MYFEEDMSMELIARLGPMEVHREITADQFPEDPRGDGVIGDIQVFENAIAFWGGMHQAFDEAEATAEILSAGSVVWVNNKPYLGVNQSPKGEGLYIPCDLGNHYDRNWAQAPIVGYWTPSEVDPVLNKVSTDGDPINNRSLLLESLSDDLLIWNQYAGQDIWAYAIELRDRDGSIIDEEASCGVYGISAVYDASEELIERWRLQHAV